MDITTALRTARRVWPAILGTAVLGAVIGVALALVAAPTYTSTTRLYFAYDSPSDARASDLVQANNFALQKVASYQLVARSPRVLDGVISELGLTDTAEELADQVSVSVETASVVLSISARDDNPDDAAVLAQSVADNLVTVVVDQLDAPADGGQSLLRAEVISPPTPGEGDRLSRVLLNGQLGLFAGLVLGLLGAVALAWRDRRVRSRGDLERVLGHAPLATVPVVRGAEHLIEVGTSRTASAAAAGYRAAAAALLLGGATADVKGLAVVASTAGEDAGEVAANLAVAIAETGTSVLLVDADLGGRGVTTRFAMQDEEGLADQLAARAPVVERDTAFPLLRIVPAGAARDATSRPLPTGALAEYVASATGTADVVLVCAPPVLDGAGAGFAVAACQRSVLVVRAGRVTRDEVELAAGALTDIGSPPVGSIFVGVAIRGADSDVASRALAATGRRR